MTVANRISIDIPPGIITPKSTFDGERRWVDGNLVRFNATGRPHPIGSQQVMAIAPQLTSSGGSPAGAFAWLPSDNAMRLVMGRGSKMHVISGSSVTHPTLDITPVPAFTNNDGIANAWSFANLDDTLLFSRAGYIATKLYKWDHVTGGVATQVTNAPISVLGVTVTPERFVLVLTGGGNVKWASQGTLTTWTAADTNSAGGLTIPARSRLLSLRVVGRQTLVFTADEVWALNFVDAPFYYGYEKIDDGRGVIGPNVISVVGNTAYWMGTGGFYSYDGYVRKLECPLEDRIFTEGLARGNGARFFSIHNIPKSEIWWFYSDNAPQVTPNRVVIYNYTTGIWSLGEMGRAAGVDAVWVDIVVGNHMACPILFDPDGATIYHQEIGTATDAWIESGPIRLGEGDQNMLVEKVFPDGAVLGFDTVEVTTDTGQTLSSAAFPAIDARLKGRYVTYRSDFGGSPNSSVGIPQLAVIPSSRR